jgi:CDP-glycerol:poly(glycerophosphate) glycerophosphotransferase
MRWIVGKLLALPLMAFFVAISTIRVVIGVLYVTLSGVRAWYEEIKSFRRQTQKIAADLVSFGDKQSTENPLDPAKQTIFLLITCGQAVRNFLLTDVLHRLRDRFNVIILSPYAYGDDFRNRFCQPGVHVLPWFENFRSMTERFFQYYLMRKSGSRTHQSWLENLEARAKSFSSGVRFLKHLILRRMSDVVGSIIGPRAMQALYHSYFLAYLPRSLFKRLFSKYRPALVISTTAHHAEAWPLTYFGRQHGCKTLANVLSWDNPTTKPAMDTSCDYYTVWSEEMKRELAVHFPYIKTQSIVTGSPLFDMYYDRRHAMERAAFLQSVGLPPDRPYILYTTNTPAGMPDEWLIVERYWQELNRSELAGKVSLLVRLHPKEDPARYESLRSKPDVAVTVAGKPYWASSDRWLPTDDDMRLLLNSMLHASVSVNVASTMSLESFALGLPTINVAFKSSENFEDRALLWSFSMYHTSDHYRAIVDNGAVDLARSMEELIDSTIRALEQGNGRAAAMQRTLEQKAAYCDGTSARRFVETVEGILEPEEVRRLASDRQPMAREPDASALPHATPAE